LGYNPVEGNSFSIEWTVHAIVEGIVNNEAIIVVNFEVLPVADTTDALPYETEEDSDYEAEEASDYEAAENTNDDTSIAEIDEEEPAFDGWEELLEKLENDCQESDEEEYDCYEYEE
jgi:hypothetical protein